MSQFPPGLAYIWRVFPRLAITGVGLYLVVRLLRVDFKLPTLFVAPATCVCFLAFLLIQKYTTTFANTRVARLNGAVLPPTVEQSAFSNIYLIFEGLLHGYPGDVFARWSCKYGNIFQFDLPTSTAIYTQEPHHIKAMLATQFDLFEKGSVLQSQMGSLLGTGIFNADGNMWKFHRSITRPFFSRERINDLQIFDRTCKTAITLAENRLAEGFSVDMQDLTSRFTLDSSTEFLFGCNVQSLSAEIPYPPLSSKRNLSSDDHHSNSFLRAFAAGQAGVIGRIGLGSDWPLTELWADKILPHRKVIDEFTQPLIEEACKKWKNTGRSRDTGKEDDTLLEHLVTQTEDISIIRDELVNLLVAGRDTTMCLLTFCVYMLAENPHIEARLRKELSEKIGFSGHCPSHEQLASLKYMRAFINEVLRLYPPAPMNNRASKENVIFPSSSTTEKPLFIPAQTVCFYSVMNLHRRTDLWGPDALEFDPDRFLDERLGKYLTSNPFIFCPFNAGPRICLGQQLVYREATLFLTQLLLNFSHFSIDESVTLPTPQHWATEGNRKNMEKVYTVSHITMFIKGGLWMKMKRLRTATH